MKRKKRLLLVAAASLLVFLTIFHFDKITQGQIVSKVNLGSPVFGRVMSVYGPVKNAKVRVAGEKEDTLTDKEGRFVLPTDRPPGTRLRVTAGKQGWFNNGQILSTGSRDGPDIFLNPIYLNDRRDYRFISPSTCYRCHVKLTRYWEKSKMAHTTSNPKVLDMFYGTDFFKRQGVGPGYKLDNPRSNGNCVICHAPSAAASSPWSLDLKAALSSQTTEWDGVSCDYCHKVRKVIKDKSKPSGWSAVLERQSSARGPSILVFGPYDDVVVPPMAASYNPLFKEGKFCATCHSHYKRVPEGKTWNRSKVYSDSEWEGFELENDTYLPIQTTYQEWKHWQENLPPNDPNKGKKCQDCHMSWRKDMLPYDNYVVDGGARRSWGTSRSPQDIHPHVFEGGTETQLKNALAMELEGEVRGKILHVDVFITNTNGGHWVPTGETMRSVMLLIDAFDSNGKPLKMTKGSRLPEWTGVGDAEKGAYAGLPGVAFARVLGDDKGQVHVPFWQATRIVSDNRIRPKSTVTLEFEFALDDPEDEPTAEAKLIYRPVVKPLAEKKSWPIQDIVITSIAW